MSVLWRYERKRTNPAHAFNSEGSEASRASVDYQSTKELAARRLLNFLGRPLLASLRTNSSTTMPSEDKLRLVASSTLNTLFSTGKADAPISSFDLLTRVISNGPPSGVLPGNERPPNFRLTQLALFEHILDDISDSWEYGRIKVSRDIDTGELTVLDVRLGESHTGQRRVDASHGRKRKRVVDEDADSAAGDEDEEEEEERSEVAHRGPPPSTLDSLSKEMKEVYSLLQRGTARGRLLAEQVCNTLSLYALMRRAKYTPIVPFNQR